MGDHEQRCVGAAQKLFEPLGHIDVEVVGRLVEDEEIGLGNEHIGQGQPLQLASREFSHRLLEIVDFELREYLLGSLFIVPGFGMFHAVEQFLQSGRVVGLQSPFILGDEAHRLIVGLETGLDDREMRLIRRRLFQVSHPQPVAVGNLPVVIVFLAGQDIEQCRFAGPVFGDEPYAVALAYTQRNVFKQDAVAKRLGEVLYL